MKQEMKELCIAGGKVAVLGAVCMTSMNIADSIYKTIRNKRNIKNVKKMLEELNEIQDLANKSTKKKRFIFKRK